MFGSGAMNLIISDGEMNDIIKIMKSFEESGLLIKGVSKTIKNEAKKTIRSISWNVIRHFSCKFIREPNQVKEQLELVKVQLEQARVFHASSSFN